jgi:hypothetical protein
MHRPRQRKMIVIRQVSLLCLAAYLLAFAYTGQIVPFARDW